MSHHSFYLNQRTLKGERKMKKEIALGDCYEYLNGDVFEVVEHSSTSDYVFLKCLKSKETKRCGKLFWEEKKNLQTQSMMQSNLFGESISIFRRIDG